LPGFGYAGICQSALAGCGGDVCDVLRLSDESLLLVIADVMGKGSAAALFAATFRTLVRAVARPGADPAECLAEVNDLLYDELASAEMFITSQLVVADLAQRQLHVGNAGHCPLLVSDGFHSIEAIAPEGMPLGVQKDAVFETDCFSFEPFSSMLLYTDGITEVRARSGKAFGQERLERWLSQASANYSTATQLKQSLFTELAGFQRGAPAADDQSFLLFSDETPRPDAVLAREGLRGFLPWRTIRATSVPLVTVE
jgi:sigma-B regulation protein RsbU (phosphoserine phosphatase)